MPGITMESCFPDTMKDGRPNPFGGHLDRCRFGNIYKNGIWKWFLSSWRCNCWCHRAVLDPMKAAERDLHFRWFIWGFFLSPVMIIVLLVYFGG